MSDFSFASVSMIKGLISPNIPLKISNTALRYACSNLRAQYSFGQGQRECFSSTRSVKGWGTGEKDLCAPNQFIHQYSAFLISVSLFPYFIFPNENCWFITPKLSVVVSLSPQAFWWDLSSTVIEIPGLAYPLKEVGSFELLQWAVLGVRSPGIVQHSVGVEIVAQEE